MSDTKITVKALDAEPSKSEQELQAELEAKKAQESADNASADPGTPPVPEVTPDLVLDFIEKTKGKRPNSIDDILLEPVEKIVEKEIELDEDVAAYRKYKAETGRGIADFYRLNSLSDSISDDDALFLSYQYKHQYLSPDEIRQKIADDFSYDPDEHDTDSAFVRQRNYAKKEAIANARAQLQSEKQKYSTPLESRGLDLPEEEKEAYQAFKQYKEGRENETRSLHEKRQYFTDKTNDFFSSEFEGFKFKLDDQKELVFKVDNVATLKESQLNIDNFIKKFTDDNGYLANIEEYHRSMAVASDPDKYLKFAYDQGKSDLLKELEKEGKNIDMSARAPQQSMISHNGITARPVDSDGTTKIVIKPRK